MAGKEISTMNKKASTLSMDKNKEENQESVGIHSLQGTKGTKLSFEKRALCPLLCLGISSLGFISLCSTIWALKGATPMAQGAWLLFQLTADFGVVCVMLVFTGRQDAIVVASVRLPLRF